MRTKLKKTTEIRSLALVFTMAALVALTPVWADEGDSNIRFGFQAVMPTGDLAVDLFTTTLSVDQAFGPAFSYEYMVTDLVGLEGLLGWTNHDIESGGIWVNGDEIAPPGKVAEMSVLSFLVGVNFHIVRKDKVVLYLGPQIGYVGYGDFELVDGDNFGTKNGLALGAVFGVDVPLGSSKWFFNSSLQYLSTDAEVEGDVEWDLDDTLPVDPIVLKIGAGLRF